MMHHEGFFCGIRNEKIYYQYWQPGKPIILIGHSMGGLIGAAYLIDHQDEVHGAVLSGPSVKAPDHVPKILILAGNVLSALLPGFGLIQLDAKGVCRDPEVVKAYVDDPLVCTGKITARLSVELHKAMQRVITKAAEIVLPILIVQGGSDELVDPKGARLLYNSVGSTDKTIKIYDGLYHEVFNEPEHELVMDDIQKWVEAHLDSRPPVS
ncbi:alpha/beta hydrolase [Thermodesulfobacteriota bacterium]